MYKNKRIALWCNDKVAAATLNIYLKTRSVMQTFASSIMKGEYITIRLSALR